MKKSNFIPEWRIDIQEISKLDELRSALNKSGGASDVGKRTPPTREGMMRVHWGLRKGQICEEFEVVLTRVTVWVSLPSCTR